MKREIVLKVTEDTILKSTAKSSEKCLIATMINPLLKEGYHTFVNYGNGWILIRENSTEETVEGIEVPPQLKNLGNAFDVLAPSETNLNYYFQYGNNLRLKREIGQFIHLFANLEYRIYVEEQWLN